MDFSVKIEGLDQLARNTQAVQRAVQEEIGKGLYASAEQIASDYKRSVLAGGKTGRIYRRRTVIHQASAPGEAPASDTGTLVNSVHVALEATLSAVMRVASKYAALLENGTRFMAARPALVPAVEKNRRWITDRLQRAFVTAIRRAGK